MKNYIEINGNRTELSHDQLKALGIEPKYVVDPLFGFEWSESSEKPMTWEEAHEYAKSLGEGWRLPTAFELKCMFDMKSEKPVIDGFEGKYYWSSTTYTYRYSARCVDLTNGSDYVDFKISSGYVRCLRGKQKFENLTQYKEWLLEKDSSNADMV